MHPPPGCPLSPTEYRVMVLVCDGMGQAEIAEALNIAVSSAQTMRDRARAKLGNGKLTTAVVEFVVQGWHPRLIAPDVLDDQDVSISPFTRAYLAYFDLHLRDRERPKYLRLMRVGFLGIFTEQHRPVTPRSWYDPERSLQRVVDVVLHWKNGMDLLMAEQEALRLRSGRMADEHLRRGVLNDSQKVYRVNL